MSSKPPRRVIPIKVDHPGALRGPERAAVLAACARLQHLPGALLPILHAVQETLGYVPKDAVPLIAGDLNLSLAEVHGVVSFYHYFRTAPAGRHVVHLCRAEACQAVGAVELATHAKRTLGIEFHGTTADGAITLEPVYCLGNCALGPALMIDDQLQGRVSAPRFDALMSACRQAAPREPL
jgi:formate dehydrogenase subunit gamma